MVGLISACSFWDACLRQQLKTGMMINAGMINLKAEMIFIESLYNLLK
jgi:hypothetical protein